jgi:hypothetical protein
MISLGTRCLSFAPFLLRLTFCSFTLQGKFNIVEGDFLMVQRRSKQLEMERLLLLEVVNAILGRFKVLPSLELNQLSIALKASLVGSGSSRRNPSAVGSARISLS